MAWKRGWKVLYQPRSVVYHEHRGTIGKKFSPFYIDWILKKNFVLFSAGRTFTTGANAARAFRIRPGRTRQSAMPFGDSPERANSRGTVRALSAIACGACRRDGAPGASLRCRRHRSISTSSRRLFPRSLRKPAVNAGTPIGPVRFAVSDLSADSWRWRLHVSDRHGTGALCDLHLLVLLDFEHEARRMTTWLVDAPRPSSWCA